MGIATSLGKEGIRWLISHYGYDLARKGQFCIDAFADVKAFYGPKPFRVVFDVGAHVGQTMAQFRQQFPLAEIYCFEPYKIAFETLEANAGHDPRIKVYDCALGEEDGWALLFLHQHGQWNSLLQDSKEMHQFVPREAMRPTGTEQVEVCKLDTFCRKNNIEQIDLLKVDAQGYELKVLNGASNLLRSKAICSAHVEVNFASYYEGQCSFEEVYAKLRSYGYKLVGLYCPADWCRASDMSLMWGDALFVA